MRGTEAVYVRDRERTRVADELAVSEEEGGLEGREVGATLATATGDEVDDGIGGVETDGDADDEADETGLSKGRVSRRREKRKRGRRTAASTAELKLLVVLVAEV